MRWYINDASMQGQFDDLASFESILGSLNAARSTNPLLRNSLHITYTLSTSMVRRDKTVQQAIQQSGNRDFRNAILSWLTRAGPFLENDRLPEIDDYFEYSGTVVTDTGLGEAARRLRAGELAQTFSFVGAAKPCFEISPIIVQHGIPEERLGEYPVDNTWKIDDLLASTVAAMEPASTWQSLVEQARIRFPHLWLPDAVFRNPMLAREPFDAGLRDRSLALMQHLNSYMNGRHSDGSEGPGARSIIQNFFNGEKALFVPESPSNQIAFRAALTFEDPEAAGSHVFAHWHGRISHRVFRLHFEWPVPAAASRLKVLYLGPKITKQ